MGGDLASFDSSVRRPLLERFALVRFILAAANLGAVCVAVLMFVGVAMIAGGYWYIRSRRGTDET